MVTLFNKINYSVIFLAVICKPDVKKKITTLTNWTANFFVDTGHYAILSAYRLFALCLAFVIYIVESML